MKSSFKEQAIRDKDWLKKVSEMPCIATGQNHEPCDPAHIRYGLSGGMGVKPSDNLVLPLSHTAHMEQHNIGERPFWLKIMQRDSHFMMECVKAYAEKLYENRDKQGIF